MCHYVWLDIFSINAKAHFGMNFTIKRVKSYLLKLHIYGNVLLLALRLKVMLLLPVILDKHLLCLW